MDFTEMKNSARGRLRPLVLFLDRMGLTPLTVSLIGLLITAISGLIVAKGGLFFGAIVFVVGSGFDMLDGLIFCDAFSNESPRSSLRAKEIVLRIGYDQSSPLKVQFWCCLCGLFSLRLERAYRDCRDGNEHGSLDG